MNSDDSRVDAPESLLSPRAERDAFPIPASYQYVEALRIAQDGRCSCGKCANSEPRYEGEHVSGTLRAGLYEYAICACGWQWEADDADSATEEARLHQAWYSR